MSELSGAEIRQTREKHGMTQAELAARVEASRRTVVDWENGKSKPSGLLRARLEEFLARKEAERNPAPPKPEDALLLRDADFAQTLQHLADLYRTAQA